MRPPRAAPAALLLLASGCAGRVAERASPPEVEAAFARAASFLVRMQASDGGFHSETYGYLSPGYSLTAIILYALSQAPQAVRAAHEPMARRGFEFIAAGTDVNGAIGLGGVVADYPNYSAAFYLLALAAWRPAGWRELAHGQVGHLARVQLTEPLGYDPADPAYGGFAWGGEPKQKPLGEGYLNISVTCHVLEGLRAAGVAADAPVIRKARTFVERCQWFPERPAAADDGRGGFFFTTTPPEAVSKAGFTKAPDGAEVPLTYGSATCDGLRALLACGAEPGDPRVLAALAWIVRHFTLAETPGFAVAPQPEIERSLRIYWYAALGRALAAAGLHCVPTATGEVDWKEALRREVLALQREDGSWVGLAPLLKEDDPLVSTPLALLALAACRQE